MQETNHPHRADILREIIRNRRSVKPRLFNGERIPDRITEDILSDARWAPTHHLTQPWRFIVFTGAALQRLADFRQHWYRVTTPPEQYDAAKAARLESNLLNSSHVVFLCLKRHERPGFPEEEEIAAVACAAQNIMLSAEAHGFHAFWGSGGDTYSDDLHEFLELESTERCLGSLYLGYTEKPLTRPRRQPLSEVMRWHET
ncbi:MAG: nitroreductase [Opitutales bacterium]|nr:nitroreductase [Opitutales bacterium]MCH8539521.1 nitroreductase [Opitutales bacterium]